MRPHRHGQRRHGRRLLGAAILAAAFIAPTVSPGLSPGASATPTGMIWGAYPSTRAGEDEQAAVLRLEADAGRQFGVVRDFLLWNDTFPDPFHTWLRDSDRVPIISVRAMRTNGQKLRWADIAAATPGTPLYTDMVSWADRVKAYGDPLYFSFNHEPETVVNQTMGLAPDFIAAWRKFHGIFESRGVTNATFMWIMTDYSFFASRTDRRWAPNWYPGDDYVDAIAADAYNWFTCRPEYQGPWKTLEQIIAPLRDFGLQHPDEEMWLAEWATVEDPATPGRKAQWIREAQALFKRPDYSQFVGVSYFDSYKRPECPWPIESSATSLDAFADMGADPFYAGVGDPDPDPDPDPVPDPATFVAAATNHGFKATHSVVVPAGVRAGDTMLLFHSAGASGSASSPPGWTQLATADPGGLPSTVWSRVATAADAGSTVTVSGAASRKGDLTIAAYRGDGSTPIGVAATATDTVTATVHNAPSVTPTGPSEVVVAYWTDKSTSNTGHSIPGGFSLRATASGTGAGHVTATLADASGFAAGSPTGTIPGIGASSASRAVMYTITLTP